MNSLVTERMESRRTALVLISSLLPGRKLPLSYISLLDKETAVPCSWNGSNVGDLQSAEMTELVSAPVGTHLLRDCAQTWASITQPGEKL